MQDYALNIGKQFKELLDNHESIIYLHNSLKYKIDEALKSFAFDESAITAMMLLQDHLHTLSYEGHIRIFAFDKQPELLASFQNAYLNIHATIAESQINERVDSMADSIRNHFSKLPCGITPDLEGLLENKRTVADIYTKALKSVNDFQKFTFAKANSSTQSKKLDLFSTVYMWMDYNSLLEQSKSLDDGIYFCFIGHVFNFVIKHDGELTALADPLEYNYYRNNFSKKYVPFSKNKVDAGYYLPYDIVKHEGGKLSVQLYSQDHSEDFQNQTGRHMLCDISDLKINSLVYVVLTYELLVSQYQSNSNEVSESDLYLVGAHFHMGNAIEHKASKPLISVDDVHYKKYIEKFPSKRLKGINNRLEDLFCHLVDARLLNLVKHYDKVYYHDESGRLVRFTDTLKYKQGLHSSSYEQTVQLHAFDITMIGTAQELEELRYNVARHNYAALLEMHSKNYMHEQLPKLFNYLTKAVNNNIENIEQLMGFVKIETQNHMNENSPWLFGVSSIEYPDLARSGFNMPLRIILAETTPGSSVKRCFKTGSKAYQSFCIRVGTADQLSALLGIPLEKLPEALQLYRYVSNSHHGLYDPVDLLWDIWEQCLIEIEIVCSKTVYNAVKRKASLKGFESLNATVSN